MDSTVVKSETLLLEQKRQLVLEVFACITRVIPFFFCPFSSITAHGMHSMDKMWHNFCNLEVSTTRAGTAFRFPMTPHRRAVPCRSPAIRTTLNMQVIGELYLEPCSASEEKDQLLLYMLQSSIAREPLKVACINHRSDTSFAPLCFSFLTFSILIKGAFS